MTFVPVKSAAPPSERVRVVALSKRIKEMRTDAGLYIKEIAEVLLVSEAAYTNMEYARRTVTALDIATLASFYGLTSDRLLENLGHSAGRKEEFEEIRKAGRARLLNPDRAYTISVRRRINNKAIKRGKTSKPTTTGKPVGRPRKTDPESRVG